MPKKTQAEIDADNLAAQARAEARSGGTDAPPTDAMKQAMADLKAEKAAEKAPTTRSSMGDSLLKLGLETMKNSKPVEGKAKGGSVKMDKSQDKAMIVKAFKQHDAQKHKGGSGTSLKLAKGGVTRADGCITKGHTKGRKV
jgi:hypothetical protein